jgi:predicted transglutaminase-like cysteine proteinase
MAGLARGAARTLAFFCALIFAFAAPALAQTIRVEALPSEPFGLSTYQAPAGPLWVKWRGMDADLAADTNVIAQCRANIDACPPPARRFLAIIEEARGLDGRQRLGIVNRAINLAIRYVSDMTQHGVPDYWSSPLATFASQTGDCEDYAIAKFLALREAGVPAHDLRLLLAQNRSANEAHAVLAARQDGHWLILDNRHMALIDDAHVPDLTPVFALDTDGVKQFGGASAPWLTASARPDVMPAMAGRLDSAASSGSNLPLVL